MTADDVKPMVDQMIDLLRQPYQANLRNRVAAWFQGRSGRDDEWRAQSLIFFLNLRRRLDDPAESFADEAVHLMRWMDWDWDLERQPDDIGSLAPRIQHGLELLERSRRKRPAT